MPILLRIKNELANIFPYVTKENIEELIKLNNIKIQKLYARKNNLFTIEYERVLSEFLEFQEACLRLLEEMPDREINVIHYFLGNENISKEIRLKSWFNLVMNLLSYEEFPLNVIIEMEFINPIAFAGMIFALLHKSITPKELLASGILHRYFYTNCDCLDNIQEFYNYLEQVPEPNQIYAQCHELLCLAKSTSCIDNSSLEKSNLSRGYEEYSLSGDVFKTAIVFNEQIITKNCYFYDGVNIYYVNDEKIILNINSNYKLQLEEKLSEIKRRNENAIAYSLSNSELEFICKVTSFRPRFDKVKIISNPFSISFHQRNLPNLYLLCGPQFVINIIRLINRTNFAPREEKLIAEFIDNLKGFEFIRIYNYINRFPYDVRHTLRKYLGNILSTKRILTLKETFPQHIWCFLSSKPEILDSFNTKDISLLLDSISRQTIEIYPTFMNHAKLLPAKDQFYYAIYKILLNSPDLININPYVDIIWELKTYGTDKWCTLELIPYEQQLLEQFPKAGTPFDVNTYERIVDVFRKNLRSTSIIKELDSSVNNYPENINELKIYIINELNKHYSISYLLNALNVIAQNNFDPLDEEQMAEEKCNILYLCLLREYNYDLQTKIIEILSNHLSEANWQDFVINDNWLFTLALKNNNRALVRRYLPTNSNEMGQQLQIINAKLFDDTSKSLLRWVIFSPVWTNYFITLYPTNLLLQALEETVDFCESRILKLAVTHNNIALSLILHTLPSANRLPIVLLKDREGDCLLHEAIINLESFKIILNSLNPHERVVALQSRNYKTLRAVDSAPFRMDNEKLTQLINYVLECGYFDLLIQESENGNNFFYYLAQYKIVVFNGTLTKLTSQQKEQVLYTQDKFGCNIFHDIAQYNINNLLDLLLYVPTQKLLELCKYQNQAEKSLFYYIANCAQINHLPINNIIDLFDTDEQIKAMKYLLEETTKKDKLVIVLFPILCTWLEKKSHQQHRVSFFNLAAANDSNDNRFQQLRKKLLKDGVGGFDAIFKKIERLLAMKPEEEQVLSLI